MRKSLFACILTALMAMFATSGVLAHAVLQESTPGNAQTVPSAAELKLVYNEPVRMLRLTIVGDDNQEVDFGFSPNASARQELGYELPTLEPGDYVVTWTLIGSDGHTQTESYTFTVDPTVSAPSEAQDHSGHHHH